MLMTLPWVAPLPSLKDMAHGANMADEAIPFDLIGYPVLQSADILIHRAHVLPVGTDGQAKMSKCLDNAILSPEDEKTVEK